MNYDDRSVNNFANIYRKETIFQCAVYSTTYDSTKNNERYSSNCLAISDANYTTIIAQALFSIRRFYQLWLL